MSIEAGTRLGPYEILAPLGAGGMGEVYRAKDMRLDREVAVKVLPTGFAGDDLLQARFEREAKSISSLNHPHICTLHDVGHQEGIHFLVMELIEGESLADRLQKGPLPPDLVLRHGVEIAEALQHAHRRGIVHRDLKPGNVMLTRAGAKLLDFGLARTAAAVEPVQGVTARPTQMKPLTAEGSILGTFQYMAPEQLEGMEADARTDIFALGAVLYEMATGRRAFEGKSKASLVAAIVSSQPPPISDVRPVSPVALDHVVKRCLEKDPEDRWQSVHDVASELRWIAEKPQAAAVAAVAGAQRPRRRERLWVGAALVLAVLAAGLGAAVVSLTRPPPAGPTMRLLIMPPKDVSWRPWNSMAISPDGRRFVFYADSASSASGFWVRPIDSLESRVLTGTETGNASFPFWSPDSRSIGFFVAGKLKTMLVSGGLPVTLCSAPDGRGGTWGPDGTIVFSPEPGAPLFRVPASGGDPVPVTAIPSGAPSGGHMWPTFLPDGKHFTYLAVGESGEDSWLTVGSLDSIGGKRLFGAASGAAYAAPGHLLFLRDNALIAQRFEAASLQAVGDPVVVVPEVSRNLDTRYAAFSVSATGALLYKAGADSTRQLALFDRAGRRLTLVGGAGNIVHPEISPDGSQVTYLRTEVDAVKSDLWTVDLSRGVASRFTFAGDVQSPVWSGDGKRIYYSAEHEGRTSIFEKEVSGAEDERPVLKTQEAAGAPRIALSDVSRDGKYLVYVAGGFLNSDLWLAPLEGDAKPAPLLTSDSIERHAKISPDGRFIAYEADESGRSEIYVRTFPRPSGKWQVSAAGGVQPRWRADGREMYFLAPDRTLMAVSIGADGASLKAGTPQTLFMTGLAVNDLAYRYAPFGDGQRFLVVMPSEGSGVVPTVAILNWQSALSGTSLP